MQKFNYHTHTRRCGHADNNITDEDFVKLFIQKGFTKIAFTDHCPEKEEIDHRKNMRMKYSEKDEYLNSIKSLKEKYKDIIEIETGFEVEYLPGQEENLFELKNETDKIILGQHFIYNDNKSEILIFRRHNFSDNELLRYAEYIKLAVEKNIPDIIAHPDLFMLGRNKFGDVEKQVSNIICSVAEQYGVPLEINLSDPNLYLLGEKDKIEYPCKEFWKIASEYKNLKVLYGVDAHFEYQIMNYEKAIEVANKHIGQDVIDKLHFCNKRLDIEWENQYIDNYIKIKNERSEAIGDKNE